MKTILLTGFDPFGGESANPSWEAVSLLPEETDGCRLLKCRLPVVYGKCGELLREKVGVIHPDYIISTGVAAGRNGITPELIAINYRMASIGDNDGGKYDGVKIDEAGPDAIMTSLPVREMAENLKKYGIPSSLSLTAGAYVCNDLYYALLSGQREGNYRGCFIHVPPISVLTAAQTAAGLLICIRTIIKETM